MKKFTEMTSFSEICEATGKPETDFAITKDAPAEVAELICRRKLWLIAKAANGDRKVDMTDPKQWLYTPVHMKITDPKSPFGFRLSYFVFDCDRVYSDLGARPPFVEESEAIYAGGTFIEEFTQWLYYLNKVYQQ